MLTNKNNKKNKNNIIILSKKKNNQTIIINNSDQNLQKTPQKFIHHQNSPFKQTIKQKNLSSLPSPNVPSSSKIKNLFNDDTKKKLTNILKRINSTKSLTNINNNNYNSSPNKTNNSNSLYSSINQNKKHFLNILNNEINKTKKTYSKTLNNKKQSITIKNEIIKPNIKLKQPQRKKKIRIKRKTNETTNNNKTLYKKKPSSSNNFSIIKILKPLKINIITNNINITLYQTINNLHINTINNYFEKKTNFLNQKLQFIHDYLKNHKIPQNIFKNIIIKNLLKNRNTQLILKNYKIILLIHEKHPEIFSELN